MYAAREFMYSHESRLYISGPVFQVCGGWMYIHQERLYIHGAASSRPLTSPG